MEQLTRTEAARELGISTVRVKVLSDRGTLTATEKGVTKESVENYKKNRKPAGRPSGTFKK